MKCEKGLFVEYGGKFLFFLVVIEFLFLTLKLNNIISWNWLWIFSPVWIVFICIVIYTIGYILFLFLTEVHKEKWGNSESRYIRG